MTLPYDVARCRGHTVKPKFSSQPKPHTACADCLRRTSPGNPQGQWQMQPPVFQGGCPFRIPPDSGEPSGEKNVRTPNPQRTKATRR